MQAIRTFNPPIFGLMGGLAGFGVRYAPFSIALALMMSVVTDTAPAFPCTTCIPCTSCTVTNSGIEVTVTCSATKITLTQIYGIQNKQNYLSPASPTPLLSYVDTNLQGTTLMSYSSTFKNVACSTDGSAVVISAFSPDDLLLFDFNLSPDTTPGGGNVVIVSTQVSYPGPIEGAPPTISDPPTILFYAMLPVVQGFNIPNTKTLPGSATVMVPQMIGGVLPLSSITNGLGPGNPSAFGAPATTFGLPTNLNVMEIAEIYDGSNNSGGGLFFADLDGDYGQNIAPLQFNLTNSSGSTEGPYQIAGYWTALLKLQEPVTLPRLAIGVHPSGDWHNAVDYYVNARSPMWTFPDTPDTPQQQWFREAGGIYFVGVAGGGSFIGTFPFTTLGDTYFGIQSFACNTTTPTPTKPNPPGQRCLLDVYYDAQTLGTNVIYLGEWWSQGDPQGSWGYGNRGDWIVAPALGGAAGLKNAVDNIHKQNPPGKVILYLEPYVFDNGSMVEATEGNNWQLLLGPPIPTAIVLPCSVSNTTNKNTCGNTDIANTQWQDYLINLAVELIKTTDVDGFFLDSWGWQMNWPAYSSIEDVNYTSKQWTAAALRFVDRLRSAIRAVKGHADAIVMGENNTGELPFHWDGGSAADLSSWNQPLVTQDQGQLLASPIRYAMPNASFFVNGSDLLALNQVFAAGHNLALGSFWLLDVTQTQQFAPFAPYGNYDITTTLSTTVGSKMATVGRTTGITAGFTITASSVSSGTTIEDATVKKTDTSIKMNKKATATDSVSATLSWTAPTKNTIVSNYIAYLLGIRQTYADALVYGNQLPMAATSSPNVVAYMYQGQNNQILTIVNNGSAATEGMTGISSLTVSLDPHYGTTTGAWNVILPSTPSSPVTISETSAGAVTLPFDLLPVPSSLTTAPSGTVPQMGLVVLQRACPTLPMPYTCAAPKSYPSTTQVPLATEVPLMNEIYNVSNPLPLLAMTNWTDWMVSAAGEPVPSTRWTTFTVPGYFLNVQSLKESSLLFYDSFGGGDFTYSAAVMIEFSTALGSAGFGQAGLSFRLSDNQTVLPLDAGNRGYDAVLTNVPALMSITKEGGDEWSTGSVQLLKRQPGATSQALCQKPYSVNSGQAYQLSVSAETKWTSSTPSFPSSTTFTVSVDGTEFSCTDPSPYFSGRFGVNSSNANASFNCLQANENGNMPTACPASPP